MSELQTPDSSAENELTHWISTFCNRLLLCTLLVCLLWISSLQVALSLAEWFVHVPSLHTVVNQCTFAYTIVSHQRSQFTNCVENQLNQCDKSLRFSLTNELRRINAAESYNTLLVAGSSQQVVNCSNAITYGKAALKAWTRQAGANSEIPYAADCSVYQVSVVKTLIGDASLLSAGSNYVSVKDYVARSDATIAALVDFSRSISEYNSVYMANKTASTVQSVSAALSNASSVIADPSGLKSALLAMSVSLSSLLDCVGVSNTTDGGMQCPVTGAAGVSGAYAQQRQYMLIELMSIKNAFNAYSTAVTTYAARVGTALAAANSFYDSIAGATGIMQYIVSTFSVTGSLCGHSSPNWCDFSKYSWYVQPPILPPLPPLRNILTGEQLWAQAGGEVSVAHTRGMISAAAAAHLAQAAQLQGALMRINTSLSSLAALSDEYSPPFPSDVADGNVTSIQDKHQQASRLFSARMAEAFNPSPASSNVNSSMTGGSLPGGFHLPHLEDGSGGIFNPSHSSSMASVPLTDADVDVNVWIGMSLSLQTLLLMFDYVYRALSTVKEIRRFWGRTGVKKPEVDIRFDTAADKPTQLVLWTQMALELLPVVGMQLAIAAVFIVLMIFAVAIVYVPLFRTYSDVCVHNLQGANGTILSTHLYEFSYNYAASEGNSAISSGLISYNKQASGYCSSYRASSTRSLQANISAMAVLNASQQVNLNNVASIVGCVNMSAMDPLFCTACRDSYSSASTSGSSSASAAASAYCDDQPRRQHENKITLACPHSSTSMPFSPPGYYLPHSTSPSGIGPIPTASLGVSSCCSTLTVAQGIDLPLFEKFSGSSPRNSSSSPVPSIFGLRDSRFDCSALPQCVIMCPGPRHSEVYVAAKQCSCTIEWFLNATILQFAVAISVFVLMNLSRTLVRRALIALLWRYLSSSRTFHLRASISEHGKLVTPASLPASIIFPPSEEGEGRKRLQRGIDDFSEDADVESSSQASAGVRNPVHEQNPTETTWSTSAVVYPATLLLKHELTQAMRRQTRLGLFLLCVACLLNVPWMIAISALKNNISYDPNANAGLNNMQN